MKLSGWLHQKLRQKSPETLKDFTTGNFCTSRPRKLSLSDQDYPTKSSFSSRHCSKSLKQQGKEYEKLVSEFEANRVEETFEETSLVVSESFHGFLSIGTFGSEPIISEPETQTFATSKKKVTKIKTEVVENDLKLVSQELEQLHDDEAKEEGHNESFRMNTHARISVQQIEGVEAEDNVMFVVCPLQGYLFDSSIELPDTRTEVQIILHWKGHPENSMAAGEFDKSYRNKNENTLPNSNCSNMHSDEENSSPRTPKYSVNGGITSENRGYWINTDEDYLVLELEL